MLVYKRKEEADIEMKIEEEEVKDEMKKSEKKIS
jgi:hypothetical protein